jgi:putative oxidoreductase
MLKHLNILILKPAELKGWIAHFLIAVPRIIGGLILSLFYGSSKFGMPWTDPEKDLSLFQVAEWFPGDVAKFGAPFSLAPGLFAWLAAASEAIGGLFLAAGFYTRIFSLLTMITMLVAIFYQKWGDGLWSMMPALGFLWVSMYTLVLGSGKFGVDYWISGKK